MQKTYSCWITQKTYSCWIMLIDYFKLYQAMLIVIAVPDIVTSLEQINTSIWHLVHSSWSNFFPSNNYQGTQVSCFLLILSTKRDNSIHSLSCLKAMSTLLLCAHHLSMVPRSLDHLTSHRTPHEHHMWLRTSWQPGQGGKHPESHNSHLLKKGETHTSSSVNISSFLAPTFKENVLSRSWVKDCQAL